jgi:hypothetical protein
MLAKAYGNRGIAYIIKSGDKQKACLDWKKACELELESCKIYIFAKEKGDCK